MNSPPITAYFASQILTQGPVLLVYLAGIILCAMRWRRAPSAAMLALIGIGVLLLTTLGSTLLTGYLITSQTRPGAPGVSQLGTFLTMTAFASSILRAGGVALLIFAVFAQREGSRGFEVSMATVAESR